MQILISGPHGLVGTLATRLLAEQGHQVIGLTRSAPRPGLAEIHWDPAAGQLAAASLPALDAVIHLAGENLAGARWTTQFKARIRESRIQGTRLLASTLARLPKPPRVFISASAVGYYGNRGDELLTERSSAGSGFLAEVCEQWEEAAEPAVQAGIRVAYLRFGMILSQTGGALKKMLLPFKLGLGGPSGPGDQFWSWIALDDAVCAIDYILRHDELTGPVNVVSPGPVTNREFSDVLGRVLRRPTILSAPAFLLRAALGEMADEALLSSTRVMPERLLGSGFTFASPELYPALVKILS